MVTRPVLTTCQGCGWQFRPPRASQLYCAATCRAGTPARPPKPGWAPAASTGPPTSTLGALAELTAAADLMRRGWHVFRALSPASSCDLVAIPPGGAGPPLRFEVRTGHHDRLGRLAWAHSDPARYDHYAVVVGPMVRYDPDLPVHPL
jgi:hypothetical protein